MTITILATRTGMWDSWDGPLWALGLFVIVCMVLGGVSGR